MREKETLRHCKNKRVDLAWLFIAKKKVGGAACNWSYILSEVGMFPAPEISDA